MSAAILISSLIYYDKEAYTTSLSTKETSKYKTLRIQRSRCPLFDQNCLHVHSGPYLVRVAAMWFGILQRGGCSRSQSWSKRRVKDDFVLATGGGEDRGVSSLEARQLRELLLRCSADFRMIIN